MPPAVLLTGAVTGASAAGGNLVNLNSFPADGDADVIDGGPTCAGELSTGIGGESIETITVNGHGGNDDLSAKGGNGTGAPAGQVCLDCAEPGLRRRHPGRRRVAVHHARRWSR